MLGGTFFRDIDEDPFFAGHRQHMHHMEQMMHPFDMRHAMLTNGPQVGHQHGGQRNHGHREMVQRRQQQEMAPFGMFGMDFGFDGMFRNMRKMMDDMHSSFGQIQQGAGGPNSHMFTQSSYMSYSNNGQGGQPKVYQASTSTRHAPGGVKEIRKTVRDSESGMEKMAIGHHINDRSHVIERSRNRRTGDQNENHEFVNLEDTEAPTFDREWQEKTRHMHRGLDHHHSHRHNPIGNPSRASRQATPALPEPQRPRSRSQRDRE